MFFRRKKSGIEWIIAGLGNPGKKYDGTRHNVGFCALDYLAAKENIAVKKSRFQALCGEGVVDRKKVILLKPQTFMNLSGTSIVKAADYYDISPQNVIVLCDDVTLEPGILRIRTEGSHGGHNGLKSINTFIGTEYMRVRIGVGKKPHPDYDMADWVLGKLSGNDEKMIKERYEDIVGALECLMQGEPQQAMSKYNGAKK